MPPKILIVEDEPSITENIVYALESDGFAVTTAATGRDALEKAAAQAFQLIILDVGLPDITGFEVCQTLRRTQTLPILFLTARSSEVDRVVGLEIGGDDYVVKPYSVRELAARIRAISRRRRVDSPLSSGRVAIDRAARRVTVDGSPVELTTKEFDLLAYLALDPGAVRTRTEILEHVWDEHWYGPTKTVDAHVASIRKKLGAHGWIDAVRGVGFRLESPR